MKSNPWKPAALVLGLALVALVSVGQSTRTEKPPIGLAAAPLLVPWENSTPSRQVNVVYRMNGDGTIDYRYVYPVASTPCAGAPFQESPWRRMPETRCP